MFLCMPGCIHFFFDFFWLCSKHCIWFRGALLLVRWFNSTNHRNRGGLYLFFIPFTGLTEASETVGDGPYLWVFLAAVCVTYWAVVFLEHAGKWHIYDVIERLDLMLISFLMLYLGLPRVVITIFFVFQGCCVPMRWLYAWVTKLSSSEVKDIIYILIRGFVGICSIVAALVMVLLLCACRIIPPLPPWVRGAGETLCRIKLVHCCVLSQ